MTGSSLNRRSFFKVASLTAAALAAPPTLLADNQVVGGRPDDVDYTGHDILRVALCQIYTQKWALQENLNRTLAAVETAAKKGANIAVTPECVLLGYPIDDTSTAPHQRLLNAAEPLNGPNLNLLRQKATELNIYLLLGFAQRAEDDKIYNAAALISNKGQILNIYRKVHLRASEDINHLGPFTPGDSFNVTTLKLEPGQFNAGTMICFDREVPESPRCLRSLGAEIIFCPMAWYTYNMTKHKNYANNEMLTRCRAAENELFIAVVNHAGRFNGGSFVVGPKGELLHQMGPEPGVDVVDVPLGVIAKKFHTNPLGWMGWGYRKQDVYNKYLK